MNASIGEAAESLHSSPDTLRYYEKIGLVRPARTQGGRRMYGRADLERLRFIQRAQAVGFSLAEIRQLLELRRDPVRCSASVRVLATNKLDELSAKLETLRRMNNELSLLLGLCSGDTEHCPILDSLESAEGVGDASTPGDSG